MSTIVTRAGKGSALTHNEVDANFNNLNSDKIEAAQTVTLTNKTISGANNTLSNIGNSSLTNSSVTIGSTSVSLGSTATTVSGLTLSSPTVSGNAVIDSNSSSDAMRITQTGTGNALVVEDSTNPDSTPFVVDASGRVLVGSTTSISAIITGQSQIAGTSNNTGSSQQLVFSSFANSPRISMGRSNSDTIGVHAVVNQDETLGELRFIGSDGSAFVRGAAISGAVDGTPGTNDMPGRLVFSTTAEGASVPTERMRINSAGNVGIGFAPPANPASRMFVAGDFTRVGGAGAYLYNVYYNTANLRWEYATNAPGAGWVDLGAGNYGFLSTGSTAGAAGTTATMSERWRIDSSGNVGIGTSSPSSQLNVYNNANSPTITVTSEGFQPRVVLERYENAANVGTAFQQYRARGTLASPLALNSGDTVGSQTWFAYAGSNFRTVGQIATFVDTYTSDTNISSYMLFSVNSGSTQVSEKARLTSGGDFLLTGAGSLGYGTGSGGTVTQATSRTTAVTLNKPTGSITMVSAAGSTTAASFTVNNSLVAAEDTVVVVQKSGTNLYDLMVTNVAAGSFRITFRTTGGTATDAPVLNFAIIKGATA